MFLNRNQLGAAGLEGLGLSETGGAIAQTLTQSRANDVMDTPEIINITLLYLIEKIPFHPWGGAINMKRQEVVSIIPESNYSTLAALCQHFLSLKESYWNDNRERDFSGIIETLDSRFRELGYEVIERETRHYLGNHGKKRIDIPTRFQKSRP